MRNSIGSAWVFGICLTFIIMFTAYLSITLNYAKAFRVKNNVISMIEEYGGYDDNVESRIADYIYNQGLTSYGTCEDRIDTDFKNDWTRVGTVSVFGDPPANQYNLCVYRSIKPSEIDDGPKDQYMYRVVTFFKFDIPVVRYYSSFQVSGESRYIYDYTQGDGIGG